MIVDLSWPDRLLHPNTRTHWSQRAKAAKVARHDAYWITRHALPDFAVITAKAAQVTLTFHPPDNRPRDIDGMLGACKAALDGIADAIGIDDSKWQIAFRRGESEKPGRVRVQIEEVTA